MKATTLANIFAALVFSAGTVSAQQSTARALQIAAEQEACGVAAAIESAVFIDTDTVEVTCVRPAGADLGGGLGPTTTATAAVTFLALIAAMGDSEGGSSSTTSSTSGSN
ncbi:hypothetical protein SAMN05421853_107209 [Roseivivax halotolerans]|uniref:Uncharacterized protein n=1 Tax=Roseivivax halotolerans TaxID=93684 RepID=A0A1I5Z330_9RHOB|nr:hypothetical protein [Roseivivax halotolerans]SFQ50862.1 hypothetical protein SAMN05421853_107209 [Roseivivax halotolerans]